MKNLTGAVARGQDFFERDDEVRDLMYRIERDHVLMLAPRRVGKTSLMQRLADDPPAGWAVVYIDVESSANEADFVGRLAAACAAKRVAGAWWRSQSKRATELFQRIQSVGVATGTLELAETISDDWRKWGDKLGAALQRSPQPTLLMIDEFPMFLQRLVEASPARARLLLDWFRSVRQAQEAARFLVAGSIGLDAVVARAGLSATINDLATYRLPPLDPARARRLVRALGEGEQLALPDAVVDRIVQVIDWPIPFHLQLVFAEVFRAHRYGAANLHPDLVDRSLAQLLEPDARKHFAHWLERIRASPAEDQAVLRKILALAAKDPSGVGRPALAQVRFAGPQGIDLEPLLLGLVHDGYLVQDNDRYRFASSLLRHWWLRWEVA